MFYLFRENPYFSTMYHYHFYASQPASQFFEIILMAKRLKPGEHRFRIAAWRPGRYELGNFAKNIRNLRFTDNMGQVIPFRKDGKECWTIELAAEKEIILTYELYAPVLNAGSTYLDATQWQINPVNACIYPEGREKEAIKLTLHLPDHYTVATGLKKSEENPHVLEADHFDRLADSPVLCAADLLHEVIMLHDVPVHLWAKGLVRWNPDRIRQDFLAFMTEQWEAFGGFPETEYHFLFQVTPHKSHHGVEHENSTICMMGPAYHTFNVAYPEFLGLASHEFYHTWNIKKIRPSEMLPYDFTKENYSRMGYVAEGVTTYMGDWMLLRSGVQGMDYAVECVTEWLTRHFHNDGRKWMPVSLASLDTWIDGYEAGIPGRKTNIYNEGALLAMAADLIIIENSEGRYSLDDVMRELYGRALQGLSYTEDIYRELLEKYAGTDMFVYFSDYVNGTADFRLLLDKVLGYADVNVTTETNTSPVERWWGIKVTDDQNRVTHIAPGSPAEKAGLAIQDIVVSVNGLHVERNFQEWVHFFGWETCHICVRRNGRYLELTIQPGYDEYFPLYTIKFLNTPDPHRQKVREKWLKKSYIQPSA